MGPAQNRERERHLQLSRRYREATGSGDVRHGPAPADAVHLGAAACARAVIITALPPAPQGRCLRTCTKRPRMDEGNLMHGRLAPEGPEFS